MLPTIFLEVLTEVCVEVPPPGYQIPTPRANRESKESGTPGGSAVVCTWLLPRGYQIPTPSANRESEESGTPGVALPRKPL